MPPSRRPLILTLISLILSHIASSQPVAERPFKIAAPEIELLWVAPGAFDMGSADNIGGDTAPMTQVTLSHGYWIGKTEVTQAQYEAIVGTNPSQHKGPDLPVENVSWNEAMAFCDALTKRERGAGRLPEGFAFTLPTEAQWNYACRAGSPEPTVKDPDVVGWNKSKTGTHPVATKQPNAWGFFDMHGNVFEWGLDRKRDYPGGHVTDYAGPMVTKSNNRVFRGTFFGSGKKENGYLRRGGAPMDHRAKSIGFRLCLVFVDAPQSHP